MRSPVLLFRCGRLPAGNRSAGNFSKIGSRRQSVHAGKYGPEGAAPDPAGSP
ncbi:hypothetical protein [Azospirillum palustre]